jgi:hypothetical protein
MAHNAKPAAVRAAAGSGILFDCYDELLPDILAVSQ